jgi:hypothetical protein
MQGIPQNNLAMQQAQLQSQMTQEALQAQSAQNAAFYQQQQQLNSLVASRTAQIQAQVSPTAFTQPLTQMQALPTIQTSVLGDTAAPQTSRNRLLGN